MKKDFMGNVEKNRGKSMNNKQMCNSVTAFQEVHATEQLQVDQFNFNSITKPL